MIKLICDCCGVEKVATSQEWDQLRFGPESICDACRADYETEHAARTAALREFWKNVMAEIPAAVKARKEVKP